MTHPQPSSGCKTGEKPHTVKVLQLAAIDATVHFLLRPLIDRLEREGYEVHVACSPGPHWPSLEASGYRLHPVPIARRLVSPAHLRALWALHRLMRRERFDVVHVHTPVAAALGRVAAKLAGVPHVFYTAHGFYFHERMRPGPRRAIVAVERALGRGCTEVLFSQSREDVETARREGIIAPERAVWIGNGVDTERFAPGPPDPALGAELGLGPAGHRVIGFIGRLVREKGIEELVRAVARVRECLPQVRLLVVGDTLESDRDRRARGHLRRLLDELDLCETVIFAGRREEVPELLRLVEVFALPSHREGMPRSVIEAMAVGLPVVATDIRGCREEVVDGLTGRLVPVGDERALAAALLELLSDSDRARRMGQAGRQRAVAHFDERHVLERQVRVYRRLLKG